MNFWIYQIYEYNFFLGEILIIETALLFLSTLLSQDKTIPIFVFIILFSLGSVLLVNNFDKNVFSISTIESIRIRERQQFYASELGKVYKNRIGIFYFDKLRFIFGKIGNNFFSALDLSLYFSPRPFLDQEKYPLIFAPLFIIGFLSLVREVKIVPTAYSFIALSINSLINLDSKLGPLLMFPVITLCIAIGLIELLIIIKRIIRP